jgi:hypothetical protein
MFRNIDSKNRFVLLTAVLAAGLVASKASSQSSPAAQNPAAPANTPANASAPVHYVPPLSRRAQMFYEGIWGIDELKVKYAESGEMIRFSYRVLDPAKAAALNDKKAEPFLIDSQVGVKLKVPQMEKIGQLRQSSAPIAGKSFWMAFSNSGRLVKRGDRVTVVIGQFKAEGLVVE